MNYFKSDLRDELPVFPMEELVSAFIGREVMRYLTQDGGLERILRNEPVTAYIASKIAKYLKQDRVVERILYKSESEATRMLEEIENVLNSTQWDDPTCYHRIEAMMDIFHKRDLPIARHNSDSPSGEED